TVLPCPEWRRRWTAAQKLEIVQETLGSGATVPEIARLQDVHRNMGSLRGWSAVVGSSELAPDGGPQFSPVAVGESQSNPTGMNEIGRASCRERVWNWVVVMAAKEKGTARVEKFGEMPVGHGG